MQVIRELAAKLGLDVDAQSFAKGELAAEAVKFAIEKLVDVAKEAVEAFIDVGKEAVETANEVAKTSQAFGLSTDALQELTYIGKLADVEVQEMGQSLGLLSRNMQEATKGGNEQAKLFEKLGVKVKDAHGKLRGADDVMGDVAEKFKSMPDGAEKTALALELFGRAGKRMIPLLNQGSQGIADMRQEAHDFGAVLDEETIKSGEEVKDNVVRIQAIWQGIKNRAGATIFPVLKRITDGVLGWIKANKELISQKIGQVLQLVARAGKAVFDVIDILRGVFSLLYDIVKPIVEEVFRELLDIFQKIGPVGRAAAVIILAGWIALSAPVLAVAAALGGLLLILNSIQRWRQGRDSLFGDWMKALDEWLKPRKEDAWFVTAIKDFLRLLRQALDLLKDLDVLTGKSMPSVSRGRGPQTEEEAQRDAQAIAYEKTTARNKFWFQDHPMLAGFLGVQPQAAAPPPALLGASGTPGNTVVQTNNNSFVIQTHQGMSPQDVANAVGQHLDGVHEEAAAALGD